MNAPYEWAEVKPLPKTPRLNPTLVLKTTPQRLADAITLALASVGGATTHERIAALIDAAHGRLDAVADDFDEPALLALKSLEAAQVQWDNAYALTDDERAVLARGAA